MIHLYSFRSSLRGLRPPAFAFAALLVAAAPACGAGANGTSPGGGPGTSAPDTSSAGGTSPSSARLAPILPYLPASPSSSGGGDTSTGCATSITEATPVPVDMFVMMDTSSSMADDNKWDDTKAAFETFFQDPAAATLRVALRFFPDAGCDDYSCDIDQCSQPTVDLGPLSNSTHVASLVDALESHEPDGNTPVSAALGGATRWAASFKAQLKGSEKTVVVLVTDGEPNGCDDRISHITRIAADAYASSGVPTFAVGLAGSNQSIMDAIGRAGNTGQAFFIVNGNAQAALLAALKQIQNSAVKCDFAMPRAQKAGDVVDPKRVNVSFTPSGGATSTMGQVADALKCGAKGGWYYDSATKPTTLTLCPTTCTSVQGGAGSSVKIVLGCTTEAQPL